MNLNPLRNEDRRLRLLFLALALAIAEPAAAGQVVFLRTPDCGSLTPCFTTTSGVKQWLTTNLPSEANPVTVDIGPGDFQPFSCANSGYITLRGMGRDRTRIISTSTTAALGLNNCSQFGVQDLSLVAPYVGVSQSGAGDVTVSHVDVRITGTQIIPFGYAWWDHNCAAARPKVFWFGSRISVDARGGSSGGFAFGLYNLCAEHWMYGSDVEVHGTPDTGERATINAVYSIGGDVRIFGGSVRALVGGAVDTDFVDSDPGTSYTVPGFAAAFLAAGTLHLHGSLVVADAAASNLPQEVHGISLQDEAHGHTPETAFRVEAGPGGVAHRLSVVNSMAESPFLWPPSNDPPAMTSANGSDLFVETDCSSTGSCGANGGVQAHLMVYNPDNCGSANPWFDVVTGACRQE